MTNVSKVENRLSGPAPSSLREALETAGGISEYAIAVIADIRGFSKFSHQRESADVATFVKRVYIRMMDEYFPFAKYWKPTGDGMLVIVPYDAGSLKEMAQRTVDTCVKCVEQFPSICDGDPMVNFETPRKLGIGVARGTVCCLTSDFGVLDYSGHLLNMAARLQDIARPSGVVLDGGFGLDDLLDEPLGKQFTREDVYLRSVAETASAAVYVQTGLVDLPAIARRPIALEHWETLN